MAVKLSTNRLFGSYAPVLGFVAITVAMVWGHVGGLLNYAFPLIAVGLASFLFQIRQNVYVAFVWWIWLFLPLVGRLVDFQAGYHTVSQVILSPLLVTSVAAIPLLRRPRFILRRKYLPFLLVYFVYINVLTVGTIENGFAPAHFDFANSILPLAFGLFLINDPKRFFENRESLVFAIAVGLLLILFYGQYQFYHAIKTSDAISVTGAGIFLLMILENVAAPMLGGVNGMATWTGFAIAVGPYIAPTAIKSDWRKDARSGTPSARGLVHGS